jgi:hypothetical protein
MKTNNYVAIPFYHLLLDWCKLLAGSNLEVVFVGFSPSLGRGAVPFRKFPSEFAFIFRQRQYTSSPLHSHNCFLND